MRQLASPNPLEAGWVAESGRPGRSEVVHGTPFERQMTIGDAVGKYALILLFAPLLGSGLAVSGAGLNRETLNP